MALPTIKVIGADGTETETVKPLEVRNLDPDEMTLDEMCLFDGEGFTATGFRQFLLDHTNWTRAEVGILKVTQQLDVAKQMGEKMQAAAVPFVSAPR